MSATRDRQRHGHKSGDAPRITTPGYGRIGGVRTDALGIGPESCGPRFLVTRRVGAVLRPSAPPARPSMTLSVPVLAPPPSRGYRTA